MAHQKLSHTAAYIAVKFYGLTLDSNIGKNFSPFIKEFYAQVVQFLPKHLSWYYKALRSATWRRFFIASEELLLPGDLMHIICRKFYITNYVDEAIDNGFEQLVVLGAGLDHLGVYAATKGLTSFEIETPFMALKKEEFLASSNQLNSDLHLLPLDVTKNRISEVLRDNSAFDSTKKTLFVAEGFFDYLNQNDANNVLSEIATACPNHRLITTLFSLDELNIFHRFSFTTGVRLVGESVQLPYNKEGFINLLENVGYSTKRVLSYQEMEADLVALTGLNLPVLKGFYVLVVER
ncbi:MAG: class I SAM-dependent methyltransferase [Balneolaceae bacterium]